MYLDITKIQACVGSLDQLARLVLTDGQVHDVTQSLTLIETVEPQAVLAYKAYDARRTLKDSNPLIFNVIFICLLMV